MEPSTVPPPADPTGSDRPPLRRPREGRVVAGVAAGLSDHLGLDVALVRLLIVLATIITQGLGLLAYLIAILVIPAAEPGAPRPVAARRDPGVGGRSAGFWGGIALLVVGLWWLVAVTPARFGFLPGVGVGELAAPMLLIGIGLALWVTGDRAAGDRAAAIAPPPSAAGVPPTSRVAGVPPTSPVAGVPPTSPVADPSPTSPSFANPQEPAMTSYDTPTRAAGTTSVPPSSAPPTSGAPTPPTPPSGGEGGAGGPGGDDWTPPPAPERSPSILGRATIGVLLVTVGVLWSLRLAGVLAITWGQLLAAALLVIGLGLLLGAVVGRARWLIWVGAILLPLVLIAQIPGARWIDTVPAFSSESGTAAGELRLAPSELEDLEDSYELGVGSVRLDLRQLDFDGADVELEIAVGAGEIRVLVPDEVDVEAVANVGIGEIQLLGRSTGGLGLSEIDVRSEAVGASSGSLDLELNTGIGSIRVDRSPAPQR